MTYAKLSVIKKSKNVKSCSKAVHKILFEISAAKYTPKKIFLLESDLGKFSKMLVLNSREI
jgi:hypothetical protein